MERQPNDGRRIERVDSTPDREGGWLILNGEKYQEAMRALNRRMYQAAKQREYRARNKNKLFVGSTVKLPQDGIGNENRDLSDPKDNGQ